MSVAGYWPAWWERATPLAGSGPARLYEVDASAWRAASGDAAESGARLLSLWGVADAAGAAVHAALLLESELLVLRLPWGADRGPWPGLHDLFPAAARLQRAAAELTGLPCDMADQRPWLRHAEAHGGEPYAFVRVTGDGVHEVPVGPVHAGIIEPGHFRFSIVGEKVLRLEQRLGYVHKGVAERYRQLPALAAHALAARASGDSAVAGSWAWCQALEGLAGASLPARACWLRAVALELERVQNHLGDLGALGNDAGFAFALAQYSRLKERVTRAMHASLGARYLLDFVVPGGVARDLAAGATLLEELNSVAASAARLRALLDEHAGVRDRFVGTGVLEPALARRLGVLGLAARASGQALDLRTARPWAPYDRLAPAVPVQQAGDVAARFAQRCEELQVSCQLIAHCIASLPDGEVRTACAEPRAGLGVGLVEGWRGPVLVVLECLPDGRIRHCQLHDPSWQAWPALEHAVIGNIVPDFPLINKSFNLSYSGHDQ